MQTHTTIAGHAIEYEPTEAEAEMVAKVRAMVDEPGATEDHLVALVYGPESPVMDRAFAPGRGYVTPAVLANPVYRVLTDLIYRKGVAQRGVDVAALAASHSLSVSDVAARLGVHESAVRQAIAAGRLPTWLKGGRHFVDPRSLATFQLAPRGPAAPEPRASTDPLYLGFGSHDGVTVHARFPGELQQERALQRPWDGATNRAESVGTMGYVAPWKRVAVLSKVAKTGASRMFVVEPDEKFNELQLGDFYVRGRFRVVTKVNDSKKAAEAFKKFKAT